MKALKKEELVDGFELIHLNISFEITSGFVESKDTVQIKVNSHTAPADGCNMVVGFCSSKREYIFELGDVYPTLCSNSEFTLNSYDRADVFCYCLPENLDEVVIILKENLLHSVRTFLNKVKTRVSEYEKTLEKLTEEKVDAGTEKWDPIQTC